MLIFLTSLYKPPTVLNVALVAFDKPLKFLEVFTTSTIASVVLLIGLKKFKIFLPAVFDFVATFPIDLSTFNDFQ